MTDSHKNGCSAITVAIISPFNTGPVRGNLTTVRRISDNLMQIGCRVELLPLDTTQPVEWRSALNRLSPGLLHAFHAHYSGPTARLLAREISIPYIVTITGSDLFDPDLQCDFSTRQAIADASVVTCFDELVKNHLIETFPEVAGRISVIPQGVAPLPLNKPFSRSNKEFIMLLPAAIRPVKGIKSAIEALTPLAKSFPSLRLLLAGGDLDPVYAADVKKQAATFEWVQMLGEVQHERMGDLFAASDLVLNCSLFEGGMANTILEAMIMGKPVLAHNILGNRSLISHGNTGWLYSNDDEFQEMVRMIIHDHELGIKIGEAGRNFVKERCSVTREALSYLELYGQLMKIDNRSLLSKLIRN